MIFHITSNQAYRKATESGLYFNPSLETEGFIHFSTRDQVERTAKRFYDQQKDLVLLEVDPKLLEHELKFEQADGEHFPHLYGALNMNALVNVYDLNWAEEGLIRCKKSS